MKRATVVIGANFGDEGKGLMTDWFCGQYAGKGPVLNVRFNGGAQAGHTVVTPDGKRHIFSHAGAGSFHPEVVTYFAPRTVLNPMLMEREAGPLGLFTSARLVIDRECVITTPYDMMLNQFAERHRGDGRHGSCGLGVFETVVRNRDPRFSLRVADVLAGSGNVSDLLRKIREEYMPERVRELGIGELTEEERGLAANEAIAERYAEELLRMCTVCGTTDTGILDKYESVVFEGAQGLLLDWDRRDYFPNITASYTGMKNVRELLQGRKPETTEICYVTRAYMTRHGAGRFDTECDPEQIAHGLHDPTNHTNEFQGRFRYGFLDPDGFREAVGRDLAYTDGDEMITVAVTHLDETDGKLILPGGGKADPEALTDGTGYRVGYLAKGPTRNDVICRG